MEDLVEEMYLVEDLYRTRVYSISDAETEKNFIDNQKRQGTPFERKCTLSFIILLQYPAP